MYISYHEVLSTGEIGVVNVEFSSPDPAEELSFVIGINSDNHGSSPLS
jgi:hypothetical protein